MLKIIFALILCFLFESESNATHIDTLSFKAFGKVNIFWPDKYPDAFVLYISGDGGWNKAAIKMATNIVAQGSVVVGIDIRRYFKYLESGKSNCYYPAGDFEELSMTIQKKYKIKQYMKPILVGYSSGATLVYGALAQAPANTFKGAISLGFCPDIAISKPLCNGSGLSSHVLKTNKSYYLEPSVQLTAPFIAIHGMNDMVCSYDESRKFIEKIPFAELITLPISGHGFSVYKKWLPQFITAFDKIKSEPGYAEKKNVQNQVIQSQHLTLLNIDLPLTIIPTASKENYPVVFFISGDGGWTSFDQSVSEKLAEKGMPVIGLDAQKYFWNEKNPKATADEIANVIIQYLQKWGKSSFVLAGYSFGACVVPFIADNFNPILKATIKGVYCFSPDETGDFEIHLVDMISLGSKEKYDVLNELKKIKSLNPVCIFGDKEDDEMKKHFQLTGTKTETLPGNHHYENDFNAVADIILKDFIKTK